MGIKIEFFFSLSISCIRLGELFENVTSTTVNSSSFINVS